jgi:manganese/zinc/iron transport system substrate-binding protein
MCSIDRSVGLGLPSFNLYGSNSPPLAALSMKQHFDDTPLLRSRSRARGERACPGEASLIGRFAVWHEPKCLPGFWRLTRGVEVIGVLALACLGACDRETEPAPMTGQDGIVLPKVVGTTTIVADLVERIGGESIELFRLMPPGRDPHQFTPTAADIFELRTADLVFYNGLNLERNLEGRSEALADVGVRAVAVTKGIPEEKLIVPDGSHPDPHVWGDPVLWADCARVVANELKQLIPQESGAIESRLNAYVFQLKSLDNWIKGQLEGVPWSNPNRRILVTSHDAFRYWARAYKFEVVSLQGISTVGEIAPSEMTKISEYVMRMKLPVIFVESTDQKETIQEVARAARVRIGSDLYSDSLGGDFSPKFTLRLSTISVANALPGAGVGHMFLGRLPDGTIHARVFESSGRRVFDSPDGQMAASDQKVQELKNRLASLWGKAIIEGKEEEEVVAMVKDLIDYIPPSRAGGTDPGPEQFTVIPGAKIDVRNYIGMMKFNAELIGRGLKEGIVPTKLNEAALESQAKGVGQERKR